MFIGEKLIYLELPKTGSTRVQRILNELPSCRGYLKGKHNRVYNFPLPERERLLSKTVLGGIRNPWDWYVSLWSFGCEGKGLLYETVVKASGLNHSHLAWRSVLADKSPQNFRAWLHLLLVSHRQDAGEGFGRNRFSRFCGYLTFRYCRLFTLDGSPGRGAIANHDTLAAYDKKNGFVNHFLRLEHLGEDLLIALAGIPLPDAEASLLVERSQQPVNQTRRNTDYRHYYDAACAELVAVQDQMIIAKHGYRYDP